MTFPDPRSSSTPRNRLQRRFAARVVAKSRRLDLRPLGILAGLVLLAFGLALAGQARADMAKQRCYTVMDKPAHLSAAPVTSQAPLAGGPPQIVNTLPQGQVANQAYYVAPNGQPVLPASQGTSGLGVIIDGKWYPEPDVSGYFYYVEVQGDASVYCEPGVPVVYQQPAHASEAAMNRDVTQQGTRSGGVLPPQQDGGPVVVPIGYAGAPGTVFQPVVDN